MIFNQLINIKMKKILLLTLVFLQTFMFAQTTPSYKNVKLTQLPIGNTHDSVVLTNGSTKLLKFIPMSQIKTPTNLTYTANPTGGTIFSSSGNDAVLPLATTSDAGLLSPTDKTNINGVQGQFDTVNTELDIVKSQINPNTYVVYDAGYSQNIQNITINTGWQWKINNINKTNASPVVINIPLATTGYQRIDLIVLNASNTAVRVAGTETNGTPVSPAVPLNTIQILFITTDSTVSTPVIPKPRYPVTQFLRDGITDYSPSENIVYDALVLKKNIATGNNYKWETTGATGSLQETTVTANRAVLTDANGLPVASATTATELGYVNGVTSGIQAQLNTKLSSFGSITTNYIPKLTDVNVFGNSTIKEVGTQLLIDNSELFPNSSYDIILGKNKSRILGVDDSNSNEPGVDFSVTAGRTINYAKSNSFVALGQTSRDWNSIAVNPNNGDVYAGGNNLEIYVMSAGSGNFNSVSSTVGGLTALSINTSTNSVYYTIGYYYTGDIYKRTGGIGSFAGIGASVIGRTAISINSTSGDIYYASGDQWMPQPGNLYKLVGGTGAPVAISGGGTRYWADMSVNSSNGDVYACASGNDIYKLTAGTGDFAPLSVGNLNWSGISTNPTNNDVYACVEGGNIYKQTAGTGAFVSLSQTVRAWTSIAINSTTGDVYATTRNGDIYKQTNNALGTADLNGGTLKLFSGTGKGTGSSDLEIWTGQKTTSGTDMQVLTKRLKIDNEGHITATTMPVYADNAAALSGGLTTGKFYRTSTGTLMIVY